MGRPSAIELMEQHALALQEQRDELLAALHRILAADPLDLDARVDAQRALQRVEQA